MTPRCVRDLQIVLAIMALAVPSVLFGASTQGFWGFRVKPASGGVYDLAIYRLKVAWGRGAPGVPLEALSAEDRLLVKNLPLPADAAEYPKYYLLQSFVQPVQIEETVSVRLGQIKSTDLAIGELSLSGHARLRSGDRTLSLNFRAGGRERIAGTDKTAQYQYTDINCQLPIIRGNWLFFSDAQIAGLPEGDVSAQLSGFNILSSSWLFGKRNQPTWGLTIGPYIVRPLAQQSYGLRLAVVGIGSNCGVNIAAINSQAGKPALNIGFYNHTATESWQFSLGLLNTNEPFQSLNYGAGCLQLGLINTSSFCNSIQVGLYNSTDYGFQIGLLNYNKNSPLKWCPLLNFSWHDDGEIY